MIRAILIVLLLFGCMGNSSCSIAKLNPDAAMAAVNGEDKTVIIEGCGSQSVVGYAYCRVFEGSVASQGIVLHVPPAQCVTKPCVEWKVFFPNAQPSLGGAVPDGVTTVPIAWKDLIKKDVFSPGDRGMWGVRLTVRWIDVNSREQTSVADGEVRLRVLRKEYIPLHEVKEDPAFAWSWISNGRLMRYTTGMRAYTGAQK